MAVEAKLNTETLKPEKAGEHCFPACNHVLGEGVLSDGFVVDWYVPGSVFGCCGRHLIFTASAATHTR